MKKCSRHPFEILLAVLIVGSLLAACGPAQPTDQPEATPKPQEPVKTEPTTTAASTAPTTAPVAPTTASTAPPTAPAAASAADAVKKGGTLVVGLHAGAKKFDPHQNPNQPEYWITQLVYSYLVGVDEQLNIVPDLATSWETPDPLTYVFNLRKGVKFHDGKELTSADVKYSVERIRDPKTASSRAKNFVDVASIDTPDPYRVVFKLKQPNGVLLTHLAHPSAAIVNKAVVDAKGDLLQADGGSGPFKLVGLQSDNSVILEKNSAYYDPNLPYLDKIVFKIIPDNSARNTAVRTGDADIITFVTTNFITLLRQDKSIEIAGDGSSGQFYFLALNTTKKPFDDLKVRQAMAAAIDRDAITQVSLNGEGYALQGGPIPPWHWAAIPPVFGKPDLEKAKKLMAESSSPNGFSFKLRVWSSQDYSVKAAQLIQEELAPLGIKIEIDQQGDWATYWDAVDKGNYDATIQGYGGNTDPDEYLYERFVTGGGSNVVKMSDPAIDDLLKKGRATVNRDDRKAIYADAQKKMVENSSYLFLFNMRQAEANRTNVKGYTHLSTMNMQSLKTTWLDK